MPSRAVREWVHMISSMCVCLLAMCCYLQIKTKQLVVAVVLKELTNIMIPFSQYRFFVCISIIGSCLKQFSQLDQRIGDGA